MIKIMVRYVLDAMGFKLERISKRDQGGHAPLRPPALTDIHVANCRVLANREALLRHVPQGGTIAELGVALGDFSEKILHTVRPTQFYAIDLFGLHRCPSVWGQPSSQVFKGRTHEVFYAERFEAEIGCGLVTVKKGMSWEVLEEFPDRFFDAVYIDAAHDYESVKKDAAVASRKMKREGILIFNDYIRYDHIEHVPCGVVHVVNELCVSEGFELTYLALQPDMFCDALLQRRS